MGQKTLTTPMLALDTSSSCCGYAVFSDGDVVMGKITLRADVGVGERLVALTQSLDDLVAKHGIVSIAAEDLTHFTRGPVAKKLGAVLGVVQWYAWSKFHGEAVVVHPATMGKVAKRNVPAIEYEAVSKAKRKKAIQRMWAEKVYGLENKPANQDVADALLVGHVALGRT